MISGKTIQKQKGFTLMETVLYLALTVIIVGLLGAIAAHTFTGRAKTHSEEEVVYNAHFILTTLERTIEDAQGINTPLQSATSSELSLEMEDPTKDPTTFSLENGMLVMTEGAGTSTSLSTHSAEITDLVFSNIASGTIDAVRIELAVSAYDLPERQDTAYSETFYATFMPYETN